MKKLVIVESPSKSKTIEKYLGQDYHVLSSKGHIRDLGLGGKGNLGVNIEQDFEPKYIISKGKENVVKELKQAVKNASEVFLATDPDREGEAISWHLAKELGLDLEKTNRVIFNEITKGAILEAFKHPRQIDLNLVKSQETRRILDRIIGFKLSTLLYRKIKSASAGRVQSAALRIICDREREILAFKPEEYWTIKAYVQDGKQEYELNLIKYNDKKVKIENQAQALEIYQSISNPLTVSNVKKEDKKRAAKPPFITSTLQQECSSKFGYSGKKTMTIAQKLYEGIELANETVGLITYMRTDSTRLSNDFIKSAKAKILSDFGKEYVGKYQTSKKGNVQDAHEAIRPTNLAYDPAFCKQFLTSEQYKVYSFIYYRALASLMSDCINTSTNYQFTSNKAIFSLNGQVLKFDGFLKVYGDYDNSKDINVPDYALNSQVEYHKLDQQQHFTEPPSRYSENKLIKALEEEGVGRPSTYATIVDTIVKRNYVEYKKNSETAKTKFFFPTEQGLLTDEKLKEFFKDVINVKYTAKMEQELDEISEAKRDNIEALKEFYRQFEPLVLNAYEKMDKLEPEKTDRNCPNCNSELLIKKGRYGKFICCSSFPNCRYTEALNKQEKEPPQLVDECCPNCQKQLVKRKSRYGKYFLGCQSYPKCRFIKNIE